MHAVRRKLVEALAVAAGLPLIPITVGEIVEPRGFWFTDS